jgi:hypothetical protein
MYCRSANLLGRFDQGPERWLPDEREPLVRRSMALNLLVSTSFQGISGLLGFDAEPNDVVAEGGTA